MSSHLITVASWEDRFRLGFERIVADGSVKKVLVYYVKEYEDWSAENITSILKTAAENGIDVERKAISFEEPLQTWRTIGSSALSHLSDAPDVLVDYTTAPRSILWNIMFFLSHRQITANYVYHKPGTYCKDWLSRDPSRPRLVYKLSGITLLGKPTLLVIVAGYDEERVDHIIAHFEAKRVLIYVQAGNEFWNEENISHYKDKYGSRSEIELREIDIFGTGHGYESLSQDLKEFSESHNVILTSLGPKPSALALFRLVQEDPTVGLCYVPANEFNRDYSKGIGQAIIN